MDIRSQNSLSVMGEVDVVPRLGYIGDSGLSRILYESEVERTQIISVICESDETEFGYLLEQDANKAKSTFSETVKKVKAMIIKSIKEFINKIAGWWDDFTNRSKTLRNGLTATGHSISVEFKDDIDHTYTTYKDTFDYVSLDKLRNDTVDKTLHFKVDGKSISRQELNSMSKEELGSLLNSIKNTDVYELCGESGCNSTSEFLEKRILSILGQKVQKATIDKQDYEDSLEFLKSSSSIESFANKSKRDQISALNSIMYDVSKAENEDPEKSGIIDRCLNEYFKKYQQQIILNMKVFNSVFKIIASVTNNILTTVFNKHARSKSTNEQVEDFTYSYLVETCLL